MSKQHKLDNATWRRVYLRQARYWADSVKLHKEEMEFAKETVLNFQRAFVALQEEADA